MIQLDIHKIEFFFLFDFKFNFKFKYINYRIVNFSKYCYRYLSSMYFNKSHKS